MAGLPLEAAWCFSPRSGTTAFRRYATASALRATVTVPGVKRMKAPLLLLSIAAATFASTASVGAQEAGTTLSPKALQEIAQVEAEIDRIEAQTAERRATPPDNQVRQVELLGKLILYDKQLSVYRNEACTFCHMPETGFTGPVSELNRTTAAYPGSVRTRFSDRKPQSHAYAPLSPVLHYNRARAILSAAISGTCARPAAGSAIRPPSKRKGRRPTRWRWACRTSRALSIARRSGPIAPSLKTSGDSRPLRSPGRARWSRSATGRDRRLPATRRRSISGRSTA